jgi:hypothetical protein
VILYFNQLQSLPTLAQTTFIKNRLTINDHDWVEMDAVPKKLQAKQPHSFKEQLASWLVDCQIRHRHANRLLKMLRANGHVEFPKDVRTLLRPARHISVKVVPPGNYHHFGIEASLTRLFRTREDVPQNIQMMVNIDGLPNAKSSASQFWPILGLATNVHKSNPFPIGLFHGLSKPKDVVCGPSKHRESRGSPGNFPFGLWGTPKEVQ